MRSRCYSAITRIAAFGISAIMLGALFMVHLPHGFFMNWFGNQAGEGFDTTARARALRSADDPRRRPLPWTLPSSIGCARCTSPAPAPKASIEPKAAPLATCGEPPC